jgi:formate hydrogenlyase transcriptional activator
LLQVLQEGVFERVGESRSREVDVRVIAATNRVVETCIREGTFRSDLYYRLNTVSIHVPPLRERLEDIPTLVVGMTAVQAKKMNRPALRYASDCHDVMKRYSWPGNVRELKNLVKRLLILRPGQDIRGGDIQSFLSEGGVHQRENLLTLADVERLHIEKVLLMTGGVVGGPHGAAALLGVPRSTLQYRMKKYGIRTTSHVSVSSASSRLS